MFICTIIKIPIVNAYLSFVEMHIIMTCINNKCSMTTIIVCTFCQVLINYWSTSRLSIRVRLISVESGVHHLSRWIVVVAVAVVVRGEIIAKTHNIGASHANAKQHHPCLYLRFRIPRPPLRLLPHNIPANTDVQDPIYSSFITRLSLSIPRPLIIAASANMAPTRLDWTCKSRVLPL